MNNTSYIALDKLGTLEYRVNKYIRVRWIFLFILSFAGLVTQYISESFSKTFFLNLYVSIAVLSINGLFQIIAKLGKSNYNILFFVASMLIFLDLLAATFLVYNNGGVEARTIIIYVIPLVAAGAFFGHKTVYLLAFISSFLYSTVLFLDLYKIIPRQVINTEAIHDNFGSVLVATIFYSATFFMVAFVTDYVLTLLKEKELQLLETTASLKYAQSVSKVGNWYWDFETNEITWSDEIYKIFEFDKSKEVLTSEKLFSLVDKYDLPNLQNAIQKSQDAKKNFDIEFKVNLRDNTQKFIHLAGEAKFDKNGKNIGIGGTTQDITVIKLSENELKKKSDDLEKEKESLLYQKAQAEAIISSIGDGIVVLDEYGNVTNINPFAEKLLGLNKSDIIGKWYPETVSLYDEQGRSVPNENRPVIEAITTGKSVHSTKFSISRKHLANLPVNITASPYLIEGRPIGVVIVMSDLTKEKMLEQAKDDFISLVSHQLRTPATAVKLFLGTVLEGLTGDITKDQRDSLQQAYDSNERQIAITTDLLNLARLESGKIVLKTAPLNLVELTETLVKQQSIIIESRKQKIVINKSKPEIIVNADANYIRIAIDNFISNASKYSDENKTITISLSEDDINVIFNIKDMGVGIDKIDQSKLFKRFNRIKNPLSDKVGGNGLGLYMTKKILDLHNAKIKIISEIGKGTEFNIKLPKG